MNITLRQEIETNSSYLCNHRMNQEEEMLQLFLSSNRKPFIALERIINLLQTIKTDYRLYAWVDQVSNKIVELVNYFTEDEHPFLGLLACHKLITDKVHSITQGSDKCYIC